MLEEPPRYTVLDPDDFDGTVMRMGGTILGTTNSRNPFAYEMPDGEVRDRSDELIMALKKP